MWGLTASRAFCLYVVDGTIEIKMWVRTFWIEVTQDR